MNSHFVRWVAFVLLFLLVVAPAGSQTDEERERVFWQSVECESAGQAELYLETYPEGTYVAEAWACLEGQLGLDRAARILVQQGLATLEYTVGAADGLFGPSTRAALQQWQVGKGFAETGYLTQEQADTLMVQGRDAVAQVAAEAERQRKAEEARREAEHAERQRTERPRELRNSLGMEFVLIEPGTFQMGSPATELERDDDETLHRVTISQPYYLGKYEVTRGEFGQFVAATGYTVGSDCLAWGPPSGFLRTSKLIEASWRAPGYEQTEMDPVVCIKWEDARAYAKWVSGETGEAYRLPTETEWEYAARAGTQTAYYFGNAANRLGQYAWYNDNSGDRTHPVGQKRPNAWGLYDMSGNVAEWVQDWYGAYPSSHATDPRGPSTGTVRVFRGGSWPYPADFCRVAWRAGKYPTPDSAYYLGVRLARMP